MKKIETDILVVGSGIAGLIYALRCAEFASVTVVTKGNPEESNTQLAQCGIAVVFASDDSIEKHIQIRYSQEQVCVMKKWFVG